MIIRIMKKDIYDEEKSFETQKIIDDLLKKVENENIPCDLKSLTKFHLENFHIINEINSFIKGLINQEIKKVSLSDLNITKLLIKYKRKELNELKKYYFKSTPIIISKGSSRINVNFEKNGSRIFY